MRAEEQIDRQTDRQTRYLHSRKEIRTSILLWLLYT
jgi:hypothetical protein